MIKELVLPNRYTKRTTYKGYIYVYLGNKRIDIEDAFSGQYFSATEICKAFENFINQTVDVLKKENTTFETFIFESENGWEEEKAGFEVIGVRSQTEKEKAKIKEAKKKAKATLDQKKKEQELAERKELERLKKKYDAA